MKRFIFPLALFGMQLAAAQTPPQVPAEAGPSMTEGPPSESLPTLMNAEGYSYDPAGRRDPFRPYGQSQATQAPTIPVGEQPMNPPTLQEPLQAYDIAQLKVVGIIWEVRNPKAMVRDPVGKTHLVYRNTKIGRNNGFVAAIREGEVLVVEPSVGDNGMMTAITRTMGLSR